MDQIKQDKDAAEEMFANSIAILNAAAETKDKELQDMLTTHQQLQDEVNSLKEQGIRDASRYAAQDNSIKELEQVVADLKNELKDAQTKLETATTKKDNLKAKLETASAE